MFRYIRLTNLISELLKLVDEERIALTPAVELSYLTEQEQYDLMSIIESEGCTPSLTQTQRLKKKSPTTLSNPSLVFSCTISSNFIPPKKETPSFKNKKKEIDTETFLLRAYICNSTF